MKEQLDKIVEKKWISKSVAIILTLLLMFAPRHFNASIQVTRVTWSVAALLFCAPHFVHSFKNAKELSGLNKWRLILYPVAYFVVVWAAFMFLLSSR